MKAHLFAFAVTLTIISLLGVPNYENEFLHIVITSGHYHILEPLHTKLGTRQLLVERQ